MISVTVDTSSVVPWLQSLHRDQIPYATMLALNELALAVQTAEREGIDQRFTLRRRDWARRNVKIRREDFAKKTQLRAIVRMEAPGSAGRTDILAKFEDGDTKRPRGRRLAIPDDVRRSASGVIPKGKRPKAFHFKPMGGKTRTARYVLVGDSRTFAILNPDGTGGIYQRTGRKIRRRRTSGNQGRRLASDIQTRSVRDMNVRVLYRFTPQANIDSRLHFESTAREVIRVRFSRTFEEALQKAIAGGRTTVIGRRNGKEVIGATSGARRIARSDVRR